MASEQHQAYPFDVYHQAYFDAGWIDTLTHNLKTGIQSDFQCLTFRSQYTFVCLADFRYRICLGCLLKCPDMLRCCTAASAHNAGPCLQKQSGTKVGEDSSIRRMIRLVQSADADKAKIVGLSDRWATWIVVIALTAAALTWLISGEIIRAVTILVVFCPCALVLATPTAIMAASGKARSTAFSSARATRLSVSPP